MLICFIVKLACRFWLSIPPPSTKYDLYFNDNNTFTRNVKTQTPHLFS
jgi:hypothetical protein